MLSHPSFSQQQVDQQLDHHQHYDDDYGYLSSSLPLPNQQQHHLLPPNINTDFLTNSYDPHLFDDVCILEPTSSSSLPLDEHDEWFRFPPSSQAEEGENEMNTSPFYEQQQPEGMPTIDEVAMSTNTSMPPPPPLSQSFSPQSDMSMTSPQAQQQHQGNMPGIGSNHLMPPSYKGHRRRRSSSLPSIFYSAKKQMIDPHHHHPHHFYHHQQQQQPFVPPLFDTTRVNATTDTTFSPQVNNLQRQPSPPQSMVLPLDSTISAQQSQLLPQKLGQQQQPYNKPLPIQIQRNPASNPRHAAPIALDQHQLDEKLRQVNFNDVTVAELKDLLRERNLSVAGRKAELTNRLYMEQQRLYSSSKQAAPTITTAVPPSPDPSQSSASPISAQPQPNSPPPPIQQLTHRLSDLGFQHHPFSTFYDQHQPSQPMIPMSLPHPTAQQHPRPNRLPHQQQGDKMSQFYNF